MSKIQNFKMYINGEWVDSSSGKKIETLNPENNEVWATVPEANENDVDKAVRSLQLAIEFEPNNSEIIDHLGDIYYKIGRKKEAIYEWKRALFGNADDKLKKDIKSKLDKYTQ